jgi:aminopeptidase
VTRSLSVAPRETVLIQAAPEHRELAVAVASAAYRAGATTVDVQYIDVLVRRARLLHASDSALGRVSPWAQRRLTELAKPSSARVTIVGETNRGYLDDIPAWRIRLDLARAAYQTASYRRATFDMHTRWTCVAWPTDLWASDVYPELSPLQGKRELASALMWFCRLTEEDGKDSSGWANHIAMIDKRSAKLTALRFVSIELEGPGTSLRLPLSPATRWAGGVERTPHGVSFAANMPTEETYTSPDPRSAEGEFTCTYPLAFGGRLIQGIRGEFRSGRLVSLAAAGEQESDFVINYLDSDPSGNGRRLGEVALVDSDSRIGQSGRTYFLNLLDENAASHIALGAGFGHTRLQPSRDVNRSSIHLDLTIGSPDLEVVGATSEGQRIPVIRGGLWQI